MVDLYLVSIEAMIVTEEMWHFGGTCLLGRGPEVEGENKSGVTQEGAGLLLPVIECQSRLWVTEENPGELREEEVVVEDDVMSMQEEILEAALMVGIREEIIEENREWRPG